MSCCDSMGSTTSLRLSARLLRRRGELLERPCAHLYETGALRRTHVRGHKNVLKRLLVHASGFNLGLMMRTLFRIGTPRALQGRTAALPPVLGTLWNLVCDLLAPISKRIRSKRFLTWPASDWTAYA